MMSLLPQRIQQGQDPSGCLGSQTLFPAFIAEFQTADTRSDCEVSMYFTGYKTIPLSGALD